MGEAIKIHLPCFKDDCGSSDAVTLYEKEDGTVDGHCFSCEGYITPNEVEELYEGIEGKKRENVLTDVEKERILNLECRGWKERKITKTVSELYGVRTEFDENDEVSKRYYAVRKDNEIVGFKVRDCKDKDFYVIGENKQSSEFFGQNLFSGGGKFVVITGGEEDALSLQQALKKKNPKYTTPIVSATNGENSTPKQIKANFEWITSFEKVIFMLDNDEAGQEATKKAAKLLKPGQAYIANPTLKDPNEYVLRGLENNLVDCFWRAERYSPIDLMTLGQMWDSFEHESEEEIIPFPPEFNNLNEMMNGGPARGEITTIGALTSIGKTSFVMRWVYHWLRYTNEKPGLLLLESTPKDIVKNLLSIHIKKNLQLEKRSNINLKELKSKFEDLVNNDERVVSIDHQGSFTSADELFEKIEWMVQAMDVTCVVIDPLQQAVPSNENKVIDEFQDKLLKLAKKTNAAIFVVSHMRQPIGSDPHNVSEYDLKGSSSTNQVSFNTILMSRDKTNTNPEIRNCTRFQLVKCRRTGITGDACWIKFNPDTMGFEERSNPYKDTELGEIFEDFENQTEDNVGPRLNEESF